MKKTWFLLTAVLFLAFFSFLPINANAGMFDQVTTLNLNYASINTLSGIYAISNMITHDNIVETVYSSATGIKNYVLTNESGGWTANTYTISSDIITSTTNGYSIIQNSTEMHLFYCNGSVIKHYYTQKSIHSWSFVENVGNQCAIGESFFIFDKSDTSKIYGVYASNYFTFPLILNYTYAEKSGGTWNIANYDSDVVVQLQGDQLSLTQSNVTTNRFVAYTKHLGAGINTFHLREITTIGSTTEGYSLNLSERLRFSILPIQNIDATYYATMNCSSTFGIACNSVYGSNYKLAYIFDTNNTLGINCTTILGSGIYFCEEGIFNSSITLSVQSAVYTKTHVPMRLDNLGNLHIIYSANNNRFVHIFQNNSRTSWVFDPITSMSVENAFSDFVIYYQGIVAYKNEIGSGSVIFYYEGTSLSYIGAGTPYPSPPIPPAPSDSSLMGLVCGAGSFLTGTTYEGGCLVSSLFILAVILSIIGWIFKVMEKEYKIKTPNTHFISGLIILASIITFVAIGMADLITGIISFFLMLGILIIYEEGGKK